MGEDFVEISEFKEWLDEAKTTEDVLAIVEEYRGTDVFIPGSCFAVNFVSYKSDTDPLEITLEAYCPRHPDAYHIQEFFVSNGEALYKCFLDLIEPFRKKHPRHD